MNLEILSEWMMSNSLVRIQICSPNTLMVNLLYLPPCFVFVRVVLSWWLLALVCLCLLVGFQPNPARDRGFEVISQSERFFASLEDFSARFTQTIEGSNETSAPAIEGTIRYRQGMYAILTPEQDIYCNLSTQWFVDKVNRQVNQVPYFSSEDVAQEILFPVFRNKAHSSYQGQQAVRGTLCDKVQINIQDSGVSYHKAMVWIGQEDHLITKMVLIDRSQITTTYLFYDLRLNPGFSQKDFTFAH